LYENGFVKESYLEAIKKREKNFPTGLQLNRYNVAIPHTDPEHVVKPAIAIATLKNPVIFKNMANPLEDVEVSLVFMIALNESHSQVEMLQQLIQLIQNDVLLEKIIREDGGDEIIEIIKNCTLNDETV
jgi:PTS system galactitol-specific IIA component